MNRPPSSVLQSLVAKLAPGFALGHRGGVLDGVLGAIAEPISDVEKGAAELMGEVDPRSSERLLPDFQRVLGPDPCGRDLRAMSLIDRQRIAHQRWTAIGGQSLPYLTALAAKLGIRVVIREYWPSNAGELQAGGSLVADGEQFLWAVYLESLSEQPFNAGEGVAGDPLGRIGTSDIECEIRRIAHAHTVPVFSYTLLSEPDPARQATHLIDFTADRGQVRLPGRPFFSGQVRDLLKFERGSPGSVFDTAGLLRTSAPDEIRIDHDPLTGASRGALIEPAFTNVARRSNDFAQAVWTKQAPVTIEAKTSELQPNGQPADFARRNAAAGFYWWQSNPVVADSPYFVAAEFKPSGAVGLFRVVLHSNQFGTGSEVVYNVGTGDVSITGAGAGETAAGVERLARGWFRLWAIRRTALNVTTQFFPIIWPDLVPTGSGFWLGNVDCGVAARPQSQVFTEAAAVTRAADRLFYELPANSEMRVSFDDGSAELLDVGGTTDFPTNLPRRHVRGLAIYGG